MGKNGVTCLIPFHNESKRLINTLQIVTKVVGIDKIICIDDGSTDKSIELLLKHFPKISLVKLSDNQGKTEAIREGLKSVKTEYTLLLDADLKNLVVKEIEESIWQIISNPEVDILILQRVNEPIFVRLLHFDIILSGQRILKTKHLISLLKRNISGYDLEVAMNEYSEKLNLKVIVSPISAVNTRRIDKWGAKESLLTNISMFRRFAKYPGLKKLFKQILYFGRT